MARTDWTYLGGSTNNNNVFFTGIRWRYRDDLFGQSGYPSDRVSSNTDIIEYQPYTGRKQSYNTFSYTSWKTSYYRYSYNTTSGSDPGTAENNLNISTTFRFDKASNNTKYYPVTGALSASNVFNTSSTSLSRIIQVPHCSDGTSKVRLFFHYTGDGNTAFSYGETNVVITLETIQRAFTFGVSDANIGSSTAITVNRPTGSSFTSTIRYKATGQNSWTTIVNKTSVSSYSWTIPTSFYALIPNAKQIDCQFELDTYNGDTLIGTKSASATFSVKESDNKPLINSISAVDTNSTTTALTGDSSKMVRYVSNVKITVSASAQNSAGVSSIKVNGTTASGGVVTFNSASSNSFVVEVIDSRGYSVSQTKTITMVNYVPLTLNATVSRNTPTDGKVNINVSGNYFNDSFGSQSNTLTVQYRYKLSSSSTWESWTNITTTISGNTYNGNIQLSGLTYTNVYNFELKAVDKIQTKNVTGITVSKGTPIYWWDNDEFNVNGTFGVGGATNLNGLTNNGGLTNKGGVELYGSTPYIDFHYNNSTSDYTNRIIENESGKLEVSGKMQIDNGIFSRGTGQVGTPVGNSCLIVKRANNTEAPNNGVVLEYGNSTSWTGQLYIGDNATQGVYYNGWSNGTRGSWQKLAFQDTIGTSGIWRYIQFDNGYAICIGNKTIGTKIETTWGNAYHSGDKSLDNFPFTFTEVPYVWYSSTSSSANNSCWVMNGNGGPSTTNPGHIMLVRGSKNSSSVNYSVTIGAFGKWK